MWNITPLPIPPHYSHQLIGFHFQNHCWLFAGEFFEPSYWLILKREGFSGDLITNSSELRDMTMILGEDQLAALYTLHHRREPDHWFTSSLRSDIETLILSSRIHVFKLDADDLFRLGNHNDIYYASRDAMNMYAGDPITVERFALAEELGRDIVDRWTKKDAEDHLHWNRFVLWREAIETGDVIAEAGNTLWDAIVGLKDVAVLAIEISYEYHKVKIQMRRKFAEWIYNASRGDIDAIKSDLREMGIFVNDSVNTAQKLIDEAQQGIVLINRLLSDDITRGLIHDYLDSLYQSVPYRDSRTILPRLVFEIGLEVAIAFATLGAGNVARRTAQAAATTQQAVRASGVAKRIGPFTQKAVDIMLSLARVLGKTEVKIELPPPPKIDVPKYAQQNADNSPNAHRVESPTVATQGDDVATPDAKDVFHATSNPQAAQGVINGVDPKFLNPNSRFGAAFYVAENPGTTITELAHHGVSPTHGIRLEFNADKANILDLTDPDIAKAWNYSGGPISSATQEIGTKASERGFNVIRYHSERDQGGINNAILDNFNELLTPQFVSPAKL